MSLDTCSYGYTSVEEKLFLYNVHTVGVQDESFPHMLTVREVKVMHMPPKPLKVSAIKISTESSVK